MLRNVVGADYEAMAIIMKHPHGALILFDFQVAFPSLAHTVLQNLGVLEECLNFAKAL